MAVWKILRTNKVQSSNSCFGRMFQDGRFFCYTLENLSKLIPIGTWTFKRYFSPHFKYEVWMCNDIPGRSFIEIHIANFSSQLKGCTATGNKIGKLANQDALLDSKNAFNKFMDATQHLDELVITYDEV